MVSGKGINLFSGFRRSISRCRYEKRRYWDRANNALYAQIDRLDIDRGLCRFFELNVRRSKIKDCRAMYTPWIERKKRKRERKRDKPHLLCTILILRPLDTWHCARATTLLTPRCPFCFVDDFTRVGHLRRDKPDNGRSSCPRKTVSQSHLAPSRINEKNARPSIQRRHHLSDPMRDFLDYLPTQTLCILPCVSLNVYNLASSLISRFVIWHSRGSNISSVFSNIKDFANI